MTRFLRLGLTAMTLAGVLTVGRIALPGQAFACSCAAPPLGAPIFTGAEEAVLVGTVGPADPNLVHAFAVERWFRGGDAAVVGMLGAEQRFPDGTTAYNTCGLDLEAGQRLVLSAGRVEGNLMPGLCSPSAQVGSPEGQAMLAAAIRTFGEGTVPGTSGPAPPSAPEGPTIDLALIAMLGVLAAVVIVVFAVVLSFGRRDRAERPPA